MSKETLAGLLKENAELHKENVALKDTVTKLLEQLDISRNISITDMIKEDHETREQAIVEQQIQRYEAMSKERVLTLEEIRAFDLLVKNKKILEPKQDKNEKDKLPEGTPGVSELLVIAGGKDDRVEQAPKRSKSKTGTKDPVE